MGQEPALCSVCVFRVQVCTGLGQVQGDDGKFRVRGVVWQLASGYMEARGFVGHSVEWLGPQHMHHIGEEYLASKTESVSVGSHSCRHHIAL